jgi:two-component system, chemotaxis family, chemotaxis protein CheY
MKIIVVEDSNTIRYLISKMLKGFGYLDFIAVESAEEAHKLILKEQFDLMLLDWNLPKMSGLDLLKYIRGSGQFTDLNVVMVTTMHERNKILQALKIGVQGYILKPLDAKVLQEKLKEIESKLASEK